MATNEKKVEKAVRRRELAEDKRNEWEQAEQKNWEKAERKKEKKAEKKKMKEAELKKWKKGGCKKLMKEEEEYGYGCADGPFPEWFEDDEWTEDEWEEEEEEPGRTLAEYYETANVRDKCDRHSRIYQAMPVEERYLQALELGNEQMKDSIMNAVDCADMKRIVAALEKERAAQQVKIEQLTKALANKTAMG